MHQTHYPALAVLRRVGLPSLVLVLSFIATQDLAAKARLDYQEVVGGWTITGNFSKSICSATVQTKQIGKLSITLLFKGGDYRYSVKHSNHTRSLTQERAESILTSDVLKEDGQVIATTGGSWEILQELNRCVEASAGGE